MKFTVKRDEWIRGEQNSALYKDDGRRCCLGFLGLACGYKDGDMANYSYPSTMMDGGSMFPEFLTTKHEHEDAAYNSQLCREIVTINDLILMKDSDREAELKKLFARGLIEVEFV